MKEEWQRPTCPSEECRGQPLFLVDAVYMWAWQCPRCLTGMLEIPAPEHWPPGWRGIEQAAHDAAKDVYMRMLPDVKAHAEGLEKRAEDVRERQRAAWAEWAARGYPMRES